MTMKDLIETYDIRDGAGMGRPGSLYIANGEKAKRDNVLQEIKDRKQEILDYFAAEKRAADEARKAREDRIASIDGLAEIKAAIRDTVAWRREFERSFDDVGGLGVRPAPNYDFDSMYAKYPHAAAYLKAEAMADKENFELRDIGKRALEMVIAGNWKDALEQMDREEQAFVDAHMWD